MKSPIIWTTIATGKGPGKHGITGFIEASDGVTPFSSTSWRARPIWDVLSEKGYTVGVVNWMISWPALPTNGYVVTDRILYRPEDGYNPIDRVTYPEGLSQELAPNLRPIRDIDNLALMRFADGDVWSDVEVSRVVRDAIETLRGIYGNDQMICDSAKYLLSSREQPDLLAIYVNGVDVSSHYFWTAMDPTSVDFAVDEELVQIFHDAVPRYYERIDSIVGEILSLIDERSTVVLCSDHGFRGPHRTPQGLKLGTWMHGPVGILAAAGPGIRRGATVRDASVLDMTPTLLTLLGEPVARDMDGFVIEDMLDASLLDRQPITFVETYESGRTDEAAEPVESPVDEEIREQLRSLGYIE
jgi:predicted AlkP superfamily phosphohydrolase/phosphomutase